MREILRNIFQNFLLKCNKFIKLINQPNVNKCDEIYPFLLNSLANLQPIHLHDIWGIIKMLKISAHLQPIHLHDELGHDPIEVDPLGNRLLSVQHLECFKLNLFVKTLYRVM